jgi:DNA mismatch repair protein MSH5
MAIDRQQKGAVGCAYYVACEEKLYCLHDLTTGNLDAIDACKSLPVADNSINTSQ